MFTATRIKVLALTAAALFGMSGAAQAEIILNKSGNLTYTSPSVGGRHFALHNIFLKSGERYVIDMSSIHFDTYLKLKAPGGMVIFQDDDNGPNLNSKITIKPFVSGNYQIVATTYSKGATGSYKLRVNRLSGFPVPPPVGKFVLNTHGNLTHSDPSLGHKHFDTYKVFMKAGNDYVINLKSKDFDTFLQVKNEFGMVLKQDDDSGPMLDSRLVFRPLVSKMYTIVVTSYRQEATGHYHLTVRD